jgi:hypothetical protein
MKLRIQIQICLFAMVLGVGWMAPAQSPDARARQAPVIVAAPAPAGSPQSVDEGGGVFGECDVDKSNLLKTTQQRLNALTGLKGTLNPGTLVGDFPDTAAEIRAHVNTYNESVGKCNSRSDIAMTACLTCLSSNIQNGVNIAQTALALLSGVSSATGQCNGIQDASKGLQLALGAYQVACGSAKALCDAGCGSALSSIKNLKLALERVNANFKKNVLPSTCPPEQFKPPFAVGPNIKDCATYNTAVQSAQAKIMAANEAIEEELRSESPGTIAKKTKVCQGYAMTLVSAASGIGSFMLLNQQSAACKKQTQATQAPQDKCAPLPGKTTIETTLDNTCLASLCGKTEYTNRAECVCYASPRTPGCNNGLTPAGGDGSGGLVAATVDPNANRLQSPGSTTTSSGNGNSSGTVNTRSSGSGGLKAADGSSGLSSAAAGAGLKAGSGISGEVAPSSVSGPSASLYGGESSGSGGGYSAGYGGGGSGGGALRSYLPGGSKDPLRANASVGAEGVTSAGGKSNFEKITDRYVENRSTLSGTGR